MKMVFKGRRRHCRSSIDMAYRRTLLLALALVAVATSSPVRSPLDVDFKNGEILIKSHRSNGPNGVIKVNGPKLDSTYSDCAVASEGDICKRSKELTARVKRQGKCYDVEVETLEPVGEEFSFAFELTTTGHLFGGPEQIVQRWPLDNLTFHDYSMVTKMQDNQGIADGYWLSSDGYFVYIDPETPLFLEQNYDHEHYIKFIAQNKAPYQSPAVLVMKHSLCVFQDAKEAHLFAVNNYLGKPSGYPDERMIKHPVWSTWARYKADVDEATVKQFAKEIKEHDFHNSQLEIDDLWETCYGSLTFDKKKFPDMKRLSEELKADGFRVTLWVHPFINIDCKDHYEEAKSKGYLVKNEAGETESQWWNGRAGVVDFTNEAAAAWWVGRLKAMMEENGIDSLKFDAGETSWLPQVPVLKGDPRLHPTIFTIKYVETVAKNFDSLVEVRVGHHTQHEKIFVRMLDKDTKWGFENGLATLITTLLEMNLVGYPLVLPDMVGGNGYGDDKIDSELFIRWLQANVFMPSIQYSYVPWDFNDEKTVEISKKFTDLHAEYADEIVSSMKKAVASGAPVNPPVWWVDPSDEVAQVINDEFMLGENILVAPVIKKGAVARDVYLPKGYWEDQNKPVSRAIVGPTWIRDYPAPLDTLPYFKRI